MSKEYVPDILLVSNELKNEDLHPILSDTFDYNIQNVVNELDIISKLKLYDVDLILLDLSIQEVDFRNLFSYLFTGRITTQVLLISEITSFETVRRFLRLGASDYILKPMIKEEVTKRISNALEKKRLKDELNTVKRKQSILEQQNQYIIQNSHDIIYSLDEEGNFTYISDLVKNVLGYDSRQLIGKHYSTIIYPEYSDKAKFVFNERRNKKRESNNIKLGLKPVESGNSQKRYVPVHLNAKGIYENVNGSGSSKYVGTYGIVRDVSKSIETLELLKLQRIFYQELFDNPVKALVMLDNENRVLDANKSFQDLFQYSIDELRFNDLHNLIVPDSLNSEADLISDKAVNEGFAQKLSYRKRKDDTEVNVEISGFPIKHKGNNIGLYGEYRDLTTCNDSKKVLLDTLKKLRKAMGGIVHAMVSTVEVRDPYTAGHQERVADLARAIAKEMNLSKDEIEGIRLAGTLHDLGKVNIPAEILSRPGQLTEIEFSLIQRHPEIAYKILQNIDTPWPIAEIVYQHHERIDGSGYPLGLKGDEIYISSRILTVADVVEAIASHRPYRPALGIEKALDEITRNRGILYDKEVVDVCLKLFEEKRFVL